MILGTGMDPDVMTWDAAVQYFQQLKLRQALENHATSNNNGNGIGNYKRKRDNESTANGNSNGGGKRNNDFRYGSGDNRGNNPKVQCKHCDKYHAGKCWSLDANKHLCPPRRGRHDNNNSKKSNRRAYMTNEQMSYMLKHAFQGMKQGVAKKKRKGRTSTSTRKDSESDDDNNQNMHQFNELFNSDKETSESESLYSNDYNPISKASLETKEAEVFNCYALNDVLNSNYGYRTLLV
jgi:hypothetical protein